MSHWRSSSRLEGRKASGILFESNNHWITSSWPIQHSNRKQSQCHPITASFPAQNHSNMKLSWPNISWISLWCFNSTRGKTTHFWIILAAGETTHFLFLKSWSSSKSSQPKNLGGGAETLGPGPRCHDFFDITSHAIPMIFPSVPNDFPCQWPLNGLGKLGPFGASYVMGDPHFSEVMVWLGWPGGTPIFRWSQSSQQTQLAGWEGFEGSVVDKYIYITLQ